MNRPASGAAPSLPLKLCRVVKVCAVARPAGIKPSPAISAGRRKGVQGQIWESWLLVGLLMQPCYQEDGGCQAQRRLQDWLSRPKTARGGGTSSAVSLQKDQWSVLAPLTGISQ